MNNFLITTVSTAADVKKFHAVARAIYASDEHWVQPLNTDIEHIFDPKHNHLFEQGGGGEAVRFLLQDTSTGLYIGRIAAFYNREKAALENQPTGGCGFFECIDSVQAARVLFDAAKDWLSERGMQAMDGSINFGDRLQWWGVLVEGFTQPLYAMNYNKPYYGKLFEAYGFQNYFNQITYFRKLTAEIVMPQALHEKAARLFENDHYEFKTFDKSNMEKMAQDFCTVYNEGWAAFEGVKPLTIQGAREMIGAMKPIIDPEIIFMAYMDSRPVGFFVMIPDINQIICDFGGRLSIFEKLRLLWGLKRKKIDRVAGLIFGVTPAAQGKGVEAAMISQFEIQMQQKREAGKVQYKTLEMGWIGDFNPVMMRMCESYVKADRFKRHVTYRYLFDRNAPFERAPRLGNKKS